MISQSFIQTHRRIELHRTEQGIGVVDGLEVNKGGGIVFCGAGQGVHDDDFGDRTTAHQVGALLVIGLAQGETHLHIAAEQRAPLGHQAGGHGVCQGADPGDSRDAKRETGEEHSEALEAAAQLTQGQAKSQHSTSRRR